MAKARNVPDAEVLVSFYEGATEDESHTVVSIRDGRAGWRPLTELVEEARQSPAFTPGPIAGAYRGTVEDASLLVHLLRIARGAT